MATLYRHRIKCTTDYKYEFIWTDDPVSPTVCPVDPAHTIDAGISSVVEVMSDNLVKIDQDLNDTGGHIQAKMFEVDVAATIGNHTLDVTFPFPVNLLRGRYVDDQSVFVKGSDKASFCIAPDTVVGSITADVAASSTVIGVSQSVINNIYIGYKAKLDDGVNTDSSYVVSVDKVNNTITLETATASAYLAATPTYIKITVDMVPEIFLGVDDGINLIEGGIGSSYINTGAIIRATVYNSETAAKKFYFVLEYFY